MSDHPFLPRFPRCHLNSCKLYHRPTAKRNCIPSAAIRSPDFGHRPALGRPLPEFSAIQTHLSHRFYLAVDFLGLRQSASWSQIINQAQDCLESVPQNRPGTGIGTCLESPLMAISGLPAARNRGPLITQFRTFWTELGMAACDPERTFHCPGALAE